MKYLHEDLRFDSREDAIDVIKESTMLAKNLGYVSITGLLSCAGINSKNTDKVGWSHKDCLKMYVTKEEHVMFGPMYQIITPDPRPVSIIECENIINTKLFDKGLVTYNEIVYCMNDCLGLELEPKVFDFAALYPNEMILDGLNKEGLDKLSRQIDAELLREPSKVCTVTANVAVDTSAFETMAKNAYKRLNEFHNRLEEKKMKENIKKYLDKKLNLEPHLDYHLVGLFPKDFIDGLRISIEQDTFQSRLYDMSRAFVNRGVTNGDILNYLCGHNLITSDEFHYLFSKMDEFLYIIDDDDRDGEKLFMVITYKKDRNVKKLKILEDVTRTNAKRVMDILEHEVVETYTDDGLNEQFDLDPEICWFITSAEINPTGKGWDLELTVKELFKYEDPDTIK